MGWCYQAPVFVELVERAHRVRDLEELDRARQRGELPPLDCHLQEVGQGRQDVVDGLAAFLRMGRLQYADPLVGDGVESEIAKLREEVHLGDALFRDDAASLSVARLPNDPR
jgi:hypothetical protein